MIKFIDCILGTFDSKCYQIEFPSTNWSHFVSNICIANIHMIKHILYAYMKLNWIMVNSLDIWDEISMHVLTCLVLVSVILRRRSVSPHWYFWWYHCRCCDVDWPAACWTPLAFLPHWHNPNRGCHLNRPSTERHIGRTMLIFELRHCKYYEILQKLNCIQSCVLSAVWFSCLYIIYCVWVMLCICVCYELISTLQRRIRRSNNINRFECYWQAYMPLLLLLLLLTCETRSIHWSNAIK